MKQTRIALAIVMLGAVSAMPAAAQANPAAPQRAAVVPAWKNPISLYGQPAAVAEATRTIDLAQAGGWINLETGETVAFRSGDRIAAWSFAPAVRHRTVQLSQLLPELPQADTVRLYLERASLYR